jgi:MscS family membrane protein
MSDLLRKIVPVFLALVPAVLGPPALAQADEEPPAEAAAESVEPVPDGLDSPHATLFTFLDAMGREQRALDTAVSCLDLSSVPRDAGPDLADRLYKAINRIEWVDFEGDATLPTAADLVRRDRARFVFFPRARRSFGSPQEEARYRLLRKRLSPDQRIVLVRAPSGAWRFSSDTVAGIDELYESLRGFTSFKADEYRTIAERLEQLAPTALVEGQWLGVRHWQWIALFLLIGVGLLLDLAVRLVLRIVSRRVIERRGGEASDASLRRTVRPFGLAVAGLLWLLTVRYLGLPLSALKILVPAVKLFAMLAMVWAAYRATDLGTEVLEGKAARTRTKIDDLLVPLLRKTLKVFITAVGFIYIADSFQIEILPLLTGLGIGTLAFGLAAKDSIENFFGSVAVIVDRPFEVGDWVQIGDVEGTVEELGFRSTRVRTFYNSLVTVPNATLVRATVDNFGRRKYRRWKTHLTITYGTPPERIESFCEGIRELIRVHPYTRKDYYQVWLHQFGPHSLDVLVYLFHEAPDWQTELRERHRLMIDIIRLAGQLGVEFAFPTQTLHVEQADAAASSAPRDAELRVGQAMRDGRLAVRRLTADAEWRREKPGPYRFTHAADADGADETQIEAKIGGDA